MFVGGLNWETTDQSLREYFEQFGRVTDAMVMRDGATGRSRGFGFLTFADASIVTGVVQKEHFLDGKIIDPKRAIPRDEQEKTAKMFVGGVPSDCDEDAFKDFFTQFGNVIDATLMIDKDTGRPRGFGFITFERDDAVERCMQVRDLAIHGKVIEVKRATPKGQDANPGRFQRTNAPPPSGYGAQNFYAPSPNAYNQNTSYQQPPPTQQQQQQQPAAAGAYGGMTPAMMAQYYQRMQQWMASMQSHMSAPQAQAQSGMTPQMMQQFAQWQASQQSAGTPPQGPKDDTQADARRSSHRRDRSRTRSRSPNRATQGANNDFRRRLDDRLDGGGRSGGGGGGGRRDRRSGGSGGGRFEPYGR
ncbi:hypothetical protein PYCC9005_005026 [Savitreella phatthalungensis]